MINLLQFVKLMGQLSKKKKVNITNYGNFLTPLGINKIASFKNSNNTRLEKRKKKDKI